MTEERISVEFDRHVATVSLNRADKHNALDPPMFEALHALPERLAGCDDLRAVVLTGHGQSFCSGLDIASFASDPTMLQKAFDPVEGVAANFVQFAALGWRWLDVPVIAALHGRCFGGGLQVALGADMRIAAPDAELSVMEIRWGIVPDMGATQTLCDLVRLDVAKELALSGRVVSGTEARELGLVTRVAEDPQAAALALATDIAQRSPDAVVAAKRLFNQAWRAGFDAGLQLEARAQLGLLGTPNQVEAVQANFAARPARFAPARKPGKGE